MSNLFQDEYFHIGGDENNGKQWDDNKSIQEFMRKHNIKNSHELQNYLALVGCMAIGTYHSATVTFCRFLQKKPRLCRNFQKKDLAPAYWIFYKKQ